MQILLTMFSDLKMMKLTGKDIIALNLSQEFGKELKYSFQFHSD